MNLPNKLSVLRVLCVPFIVVLMMIPNRDWQWASLGLFVLASFTDYLDGHIARKHHLITDFGKFIDPVADKLLVLSTLIMLIYRGFMPAWAVVVILTRELCVDGLRLIAVTKGKVIAAGPLGKIKTVLQMFMIIWALALQKPILSHWTGLILFTLAVAMTLISGIDYFRRNKSVFDS